MIDDFSLFEKIFSIYDLDKSELQKVTDGLKIDFSKYSISKEKYFKNLSYCGMFLKTLKNNKKNTIASEDFLDKSISALVLHLNYVLIKNGNFEWEDAIIVNKLFYEFSNFWLKSFLDISYANKLIKRYSKILIELELIK